MKFTARPSPNFNERKDGAKPELIVIHYTGMKSTEEALQRLCDAKAEVSAHYLIDEQGKIFRLVDEEKRAWHAGVSSWQGKEDVNSRSIGIELSNRGGKPYPPEQLKSLIELCQDIMKRHGIPPQNVVGHSDVAPGRKNDPGTHFPWKKMAEHGIGYWPKPTLREKFNAIITGSRSKNLKKLFEQAGYSKEPSLTQLVKTFQQRYEPRKRLKGRPAAATVAKLRALARLNRKKSA